VRPASWHAKCSLAQLHKQQQQQQQKNTGHAPRPQIMTTSVWEG
jgi:hypothetical protein